MRNIKFRGKRIDNGEMIYGSLVQIGETCEICDINTVDYSRYEVHPNTVGQFTGLPDKNGTEIYEGDIVKEVYIPINSNPTVIEYYKEAVIVWCEKGFGRQIKIDGTKVLDESRALSFYKTERKVYRHPTEGEDWVDTFSSFKRLEVIGNIHEHSDLLNL